jgi:hypothetical protein
MNNHEEKNEKTEKTKTKRVTKMYKIKYQIWIIRAVED